MLPPASRTPAVAAPAAVSHGGALQPESPLVPFGEESDRTSTAVRCVAAAEIYKLTGHLPAWARPLPAQLGDAVVLCTEIRMQGTGRHRSFGDPHEVVCRPQAIGRGSRLAWLAPNHKRGVTNKRVLWGFIKPE